MKNIINFTEFIFEAKIMENKYPKEYLDLVKKVIPNFEKIIVTKEDLDDAKKIYKDSLKDEYWKDSRKLNDSSIDTLNNGIMKIMNAMKEKYKDANWDVIQKPMYDIIHSGLT